MWDLPGPGLEPVSPASAGRLSTTAPQGKPEFVILDDSLSSHFFECSCACLFSLRIRDRNASVIYSYLETELMFGFGGKKV